MVDQWVGMSRPHRQNIWSESGLEEVGNLLGKRGAHSCYFGYEWKSHRNAFSP